VDTVNNYHQIVRFQQYECIANGNYLSAWEPLNIEDPSNSEWQRHRLVFPTEYDMIGVAPTNEFLVMALAVTVTDATATAQAGFLAFWSGTSPTYDFIVPIPEGSPQGLHTYDNVAYYYAGGDWYAVSSPVTKPVKMRSMPGSSTEYSGTNTPVTVHPYAATVRRGIHLMAWPSAVANTDIQFGVYSWGRTDKNYPETLGYNYIPSTGSQNYSGSNNLQLGGLWSYGDILLLSWRDSENGGYGVDTVTNASKPASTAIWDSLIVDNGALDKEFVLHFISAAYYLPAGATLKLGYKLDRASDWTYSEEFTSTNLWDGQTGYARFNVGDDDTGGRCREAQMRVMITCDSTVTTPPILRAAAMIVDPLRDEELL
jgi:hypothetical protein